MEQQQDFLNIIESGVFNKDGNDVYIGKQKISPEILELIKDQAMYIKTSKFYEVFRSSIINQALNMALSESKEWDHVLAAKMLYHWQFFLDNIIETLTRKE